LNQNAVEQRLVTQELRWERDALVAEKALLVKEKGAEEMRRHRVPWEPRFSWMRVAMEW